jgi:hypothetical protein
MKRNKSSVSQILSNRFYFSDNRRVIKRAVCLQRLRIELFSRPAIKTSSVSRVVLYERTAQIFVPTSKKLSENSYLIAKHRLVNPVSNILKNIFQ